MLYNVAAGLHKAPSIKGVCTVHTAPKVFILPDYKQDLRFDPIGSSSIIQFDVRVYLVHQDMRSHY